MAIRKRSSVVKSWAIWAIYDMTDMQKSTRNCSTDLCTRLVVTVNWVISPQNTYSLGWLYRGWRHIGHVRLEKKKKTERKWHSGIIFPWYLLPTWYKKGVQGSYKFLDPKFKTFSRLFPKQCFIFLDSRLTNRWSIEKHRNQTFFMMHCKCTVTTVQCGHRELWN